MKKLKTGLRKLRGPKVEAVVGAVLSVAVALVPVLLSTNWQTIAGAALGVAAIVRIIDQRLQGHQKWDMLVAEYGPQIAVDWKAAEKILLGLGSPPVTKAVEVAETVIADVQASPLDPPPLAEKPVVPASEVPA